MPKLWLYNLHYFEYLWALGYKQAKKLVLDWIENHPLREKQVGWEPYPTSLRLMNLCGVFFNQYRAHTEQDSVFLNRLWASIYLQTQWLSEHLETHLMGNHLFENGAALAFVGSCFSSSAAERWFHLGKRILERQIPEQILGDGMHFERSPMYHCRIVYLLAMLFSTGSSELVDIAKAPLLRVVNALVKLVHPDGQIALLNDSAFAVYNTPGELVAYVRDWLVGNKEETETVANGPFALSDAGYYGFRDDAGTYIVCDAAPIGPDYIPGHAHADILSFELSLQGHRVIVDSGVYDYEPSSMRSYCRSTKAHNTVEIEDMDQCEMWAAFRVGCRGYPRDVRWIPSSDGFRLKAWHDGYKRLKGRPKHSRRFSWNKSSGLVVEDRIVASCAQNVVSCLHLHPACKIGYIENNAAEVIYPKGRFQVAFRGEGKLAVETSAYCPEFGRKVENPVLVYRVSSPHIEISMHLQELAG
ncbi:heparinase II/III family protein [Planctomycetota bacterium]